MAQGLGTPAIKGSGEGNGTPLQYSCLENPMDRGAWWATVHGIAEGRTYFPGGEALLLPGMAAY